MYLGAGTVLRCPVCDQIAGGPAALLDRHVVHVTEAWGIEMPRSWLNPTKDNDEAQRSYSIASARKDATLALTVERLGVPSCRSAAIRGSERVIVRCS